MAQPRKKKQPESADSPAQNPNNEHQETVPPPHGGTGEHTGEPPSDATEFDPAVLENTPAVKASAPATTSPADTRDTPGRGWTERFTHPAKYRRFVAKDEMGREKIFFKFDVPAGQSTPDSQVIEVMRAHKKTDDEYGTGLQFKDNPKFGKVWQLPSTELGRKTADRIDEALQGVAKKIEGDSPTPG